MPKKLKVDLLADRDRDCPECGAPCGWVFMKREDGTAIVRCEHVKAELEVARLVKTIDLLELKLNIRKLADLGFVRSNQEALFKDQFKWAKVKGGFWRVDHI